MQDIDGKRIGNAPVLKYILASKYFDHDEQECGGSADLILSVLELVSQSKAKHYEKRKIGSRWRERVKCVMRS